MPSGVLPDRVGAWHDRRMTFDPDATGSGDERPGALVAVVADDLIWASRIVAAVQRAGGTSVRMGSDQELELALEAVMAEEPDPNDPDPRRIVGAVVDLFGHRYDGVEAVKAVHSAGLPVIAVAQCPEHRHRPPVPWQ